MRPPSKALFDLEERDQLTAYGFHPRKGRYHCAYAKDCYEIYISELGSQRFYSLSYNNRRVYGPIAKLSRVIEEYCLLAGDYEQWNGVPRKKSPFRRSGRKRMDRAAWCGTSSVTPAIAAGEQGPQLAA